MAVTNIDNGVSDTTVFNRNDGTFTVIGSQASETVEVGALTVVSGPLTVTAGGLAITAGGLDVNGTELILDADADTSITADTDDQIDIKISAADDFRFTANTFTVLNGSKISALCGASAAVSASGLLLGGGTDANPNTTSTADAKFIEFRCATTATSGDNRLAYLSYNIGAAGGGECLRARTILAATTTGTAHGAHLGLTASSTGAITGLGVGCRGTLELTNTALPAGGTYYGGYFEVYSSGSSSSVAAVTKHAVLGIGATGDATGAATVLNALSFDGTSAADATKMISSVSLAELPAGTVGIAVLVNGTRYYIPAVVTTEWN